MPENVKFDFKYKCEYTVKRECIIKKGITIISYKGKSKDIVIPDKIEGLPVVAIGNCAFYKNQITNIIIPDSVKTILVNTIIPCVSIFIKDTGKSAF